MKFLCDRCKTRYSIGDDRVRGKILKIRCKNCANVITVREGMSDIELADDGTPAAKRAGRPTTMAPPEQRVMPAPPASSAPAAAAATPKPPAALEEEWYVSIDGDQQGPFSLTEAQAWVGEQAADADLHCWSEGFDDWLPVDKVSHFRGTRRKAPPRAQPPRAPGRPTLASEAQARFGGAAAAATSTAEEEPKSLFTATLASIEASVTEPAPAPKSGTTPPPIAPAPPKATPPGGVAVVETKSDPTPAAVKNGKTVEPVAVEPESEPDGAVAAKPPEPAGPEAAAAAAPKLDLAAPTRAPGTTDSGQDSQGDLDIGEVSRVVNLADLMRQAPPRKDRSAPVRRPTAAGGVAALRTGSQPVLRSTTSTPKLEAAAVEGAAAGGVDLAAPGVTPGIGETAAATIPVAPVITATSPRSMYLAVGGAVAVIAAVIVVALVLRGGHDDDEDVGGLGRVGQVDMERPDDPSHRVIPTTPQTGPGSAGSATTTTTATSGIKHPTGNGGTTRPNGTGNPLLPNGSGDGGKTEIDLTKPGVLTALKPEEVEDMSAKQGMGTQRCYEQALKRDQFLDVKRIVVTLTVDPLGSVTDVKLSDHDSDQLGKCLSSRIHGWKFRPSTSGITAQLTLAFASG